MSLSNSKLNLTSSPNISPRSAMLALLVLAPIPTVGVYFAAIAQASTFGSAIWALAKILLFIGPAVIWFLFQRQAFVWPRFELKGLLTGFVSGVVLGAIIFLSYWYIARPMMSFGSLQSMLQEAGVDSVQKYIVLVAYLTLVNSLIEEYVFRWFFLTQLKTLFTPLVAVFLSAVIFTFHHSVVLTAYVPWYFNVLASFGVFTGGLVWSYLYQQYGQIWPSYLSHIGADIGVFLIGYHALFVAAG